MDKPDRDEQEPISLSDRFLGTFFFPTILLALGVFYFILTLIQNPLLAFRDFQTFRHEAFAKLWAAKGKEMSQEFAGQELLATAKGVVLDLGPGTGECLRLFTPSLITTAYGPEPAVDMHPALQANIDKSGLNGKYKILAAGAEPDSLIPALAKKGVFAVSGISSEGVFDTILCTRVLCGVPHTEETIQQLFRLLKPGGRMIVSEHVTSPWPMRNPVSGVFGFVMQKVLILLGWNFWMGGCTLNKKTFQMLVDAGGQGGWANVDVQYARSWHTVPFVVGILTKA